MRVQKIGCISSSGSEPSTSTEEAAGCDLLERVSEALCVGLLENRIDLDISQLSCTPTANCYSERNNWWEGAGE